MYKTLCLFNHVQGLQHLMLTLCQRLMVREASQQGNN